MTTLSAFYDLAISPTAYDFIQFLIKAELARARAKADQLHVVIVPCSSGIGGMFRDDRKIYDEQEMRFRLWNICIPACALVGATVTLATGWDQAKRLRGDFVFPDDWDHQTRAVRHHMIGDGVKRSHVDGSQAGGVFLAAKNGERIPKLNASQHARRNVRKLFDSYGRPVVTLTLRRQSTPDRNSDPAVWNEVRRHIESRGCYVMVIQDTLAALAAGAGYAELNLDLRMACYQEAAQNLIGTMGPAILLWFSDAPYLQFGAGIRSTGWNGLVEAQGLPMGNMVPWARTDQRLVYGVETSNLIIEEFERWASATK